MIGGRFFSTFRRYFNTKSSSFKLNLLKEWKGRSSSSSSLTISSLTPLLGMILGGGLLVREEYLLSSFLSFLSFLG